MLVQPPRDLIEVRGSPPTVIFCVTSSIDGCSDSYFSQSARTFAAICSPYVRTACSSESGERARERQKPCQKRKASEFGSRDFRQKPQRHEACRMEFLRTGSVSWAAFFSLETFGMTDVLAATASVFTATVRKCTLTLDVFEEAKH
eukprot:3016859-Rhodomonas_salina.1